jgi:hypothetical protein
LSGLLATFFQEIEVMEDMERVDQAHQLSIDIPVERLEEYLGDDRFTTELYYLVRQETDKLYNQLTTDNFPIEPGKAPYRPDTLLARVEKYEAMTAPLISILIVGSRWGNSDHYHLWQETILRIGNHQPVGPGVEKWTKLMRYPVLLLLYAAGMASLITENYDLLYRLLIDTPMKINGKSDSAVVVINPDSVLNGNFLPGKERTVVATSERLFTVLRDPFRQLVADEVSYNLLFDRFEYLYSLAMEDRGELTLGHIGRFAYRNDDSSLTESQKIVKIVGAEVRELKDQWPPLVSGFFDGSMEKCNRAIQTLDDFLAGFEWWYFH